MKRILFLLFCCTLTIAQAENEQTIKADPVKATVFLNGAQIFHSKYVTVSPGTTNIIVEGVPQSIDQNSIQAGGTGDFTILDVQYRLFYPEPVNNTELPTKIQKQIKMVQDSMEQVGYTKTDIANKIDVLQIQKQLLLNNKLLQVAGSSDSLELIKQSIEYYDGKLNAIYKEMLQLTKADADQNKLMQQLQMRLNELNNYWAQENAKRSANGPVPQIIVTVSADHTASGTLEVNYLTYNAGWYATYDVRASDITKPVQLQYKANIWQTTGIDWKDVKISCSTGNPTQGNNLPQLTTWYVGYYNYYYERDYKKAESAPEMQDDMTLSEVGQIASGATAKDLNNAANYTTQVQTIANVQFDIDLKYNIPSDGKGHIVSLKSQTLPSDYNYLIVPKLEQSAFLIARITNWEEVNLLPGNANIYFDNTYVGKTYLDPLALNDTLSLSLGRDKSIEVKRKMLSEKSTDKILSTNNKKTMAFEISVRNGKPITTEIIVMDQIPISQSNDIKVEVTDLGKGELDELSGFVTWRKKIKSKELVKYNLEFEITYPKGQTLSMN